MRLEPEGRSASRSAFDQGGRYLGILRNGTFSGLTITSVQGTGYGQSPTRRDESRVSSGCVEVGPTSHPIGTASPQET
jgi:hypothetical protein